jgi:Phosphotransferase enzyme family
VVEIPRSLRAIDAGWLTDALREAGHDAPAVHTVSFEPMSGVVGGIGEVGVLSITYAGATTLPAKLVGKCPLDHESARQYDKILQFYRREAGFYRDLAHAVPMRVPQCFVNLHDGDDTLLLLECIEGGVDGDILAGTSFAAMERLVSDLARLHGRYWMDPRLGELDWVLDWSTPSFLGGIPLVQQAWPVVNARRPDLYPADLARVCQSYMSDSPRWLAAMTERPWTFVHGDYELDNMIFTGDDAVIVDWQGCMRSFPGYDLGWALAASASPETVAREGELLDTYRAVLAVSGGPAWSADDLLDDLAWSMMYYASGSTVPTMQDYAQMGAQGERLVRRFEAFLERCVAAALRWEVPERIGPLV